MPAKSGRTVHEQTARTGPETEATPNASALLARAPRDFITDAWVTKTERAPARKRAGTRHRSTCSRAYHLRRWSASSTAPSNRGEPTGREKTPGKPPTTRISAFDSRFQSTV